MNKEREIINETMECLYNSIKSKDKIINEQVLEIARLKEQLENDIDRYEDTISYQLGFDKGKEYLQQKIDKAINYIKKHSNCSGYFEDGKMIIDNIESIYGGYELLEILGDKE